MNNSIIAYNPCSKCEKDKCNICELNMYRQGTLKKDKWISVEERLPDADDFYLCISYCGCYEIYWFNTKHKLFNASDDCAEWAINVPYWMPLPTPPKMKGAD